MFKFLHISDIHLGYRQYKLAEREGDFYKSLKSICSPEYIKKNNIDFVIVTGDLFDMPNISAHIFNQAVFVFETLKTQCNIPVIAIEGNHDLKETLSNSNSKGSWYEALAQNELMYFLRTRADNNGNLTLNELTPDKYMGGSYLDLEINNHSVRFVGSAWHGAKSSQVLSTYKEQIINLNKTNNKQIDFNLFLFHGGHESQLPIEHGGISNSDLLQLENYADYIGLGHIHQNYIINNTQGQPLAFNPGSLEANNISEAWIERGAFVITVDDGNNISDIYLEKNYIQRIFHQIQINSLGKYISLEELLSDIKIKTQEYLDSYQNIEPVILYYKLTGEPSFELDNQELAVLEKEIKSQDKVLYCIFKVDIDYMPFIYSEDIKEQQGNLENNIFDKVITGDSTIQEAQKEVYKKYMKEIKEDIERELPAEELVNKYTFQL